VKIVLIGIILISITFNSYSGESKVIVVDDTEYSIVIPDNVEDLRVAYIRAMTAWLGESQDYVELKAAFDIYQTSTDETIASKDKVIKTQKELIIIKDARIAKLEASRSIFSIIPSAHYSVTPDGSSGGLGIGVLLFDALYIEALGSYPLQATFSIGWKF